MKQKFFCIPHLPNKCSNSVIIDHRVDKNTINALNALGIEVIFSYKSNRLHSAVCGHPDMTIMHLGYDKFLCSPDSYEYYKLQLPCADVIKGTVELDLKYPYDISYNITILQDFVFMNTASNQIEIYKSYIPMEKKILNVNQGYTKCNICVVNENAIITSDTGIYKASIENGIDALLIQQGYIELNGMNYGFIGGATGLLSQDTLAVNGDINTHADCDKIIAFCKNYGVNVISLKKGAICDIGSIVPVF